ncbi:MAG: transcription-repair coupling factor, partial [Atopobiaceae bacterium]|nr:transcription-repair coupling factor [Atopobiaceae bacterium]
DLFTQMLGEAVAEARGETREVELPEVTINLPADFFLSEDYLPEVDKRVLVYRRLAAATELDEVNAIEQDCENSWGTLPVAGKNLFDRARVRIRAQRLGATSVSLANGRLVYQGLFDVPKTAAFKIKQKGGLVFPKSGKVTMPFKRTQEEIMPAALGLLEEIGGDDEAEE